MTSLDDLVSRIDKTDDHYAAAIEIAATLYDGSQQPDELLLTVIDAIERKTDQRR